MIKKSNPKLPLIKANPKILLFLLIVVGLSVWRFQSLPGTIKQGPVTLEATLLDEPRIYERWQYFFVEGYRIKTPSDEIYKYGDILKIDGNVEEGRVSDPEIQKVGESRFYKPLFAVRNRLKEQIFRALPQPQASFLAGILLGAREDLPEEFDENLIKTGTIHVVVVSGYNIAVVGGFLAILSRFMNRRLASILAIIGISLYTLLVGADPPALRAAIMGSLAFFAVLSGRQRLSLYSLILAGLIMLFINPTFVSNISFQLSFMATAGIIFFHRYLFSLVKKLPNPINEDLAITLSAQILVVPLIFYHFGSVSLISPLVNSLVLWIIPLSTIVGFVFLVVSFIFWPIAILISWLLWALTSVFVFVVNLFANLGFAHLEFEENNFIPIAFYYAGVICLIIYFKYGRVAKKE